MLFNQNKGFFLTLDETAEPVSLDLPDAAAVEEPAADASVTEQPSLVVASVETPVASEATTSEAKAVDEVAATGAAVQTTAEAIAAELAATQAARPVVTMSTYAPDNLMPGAGLMARKRRPGAGMKGFMTIAGDLFKS
jgi:hypothetical protein